MDKEKFKEKIQIVIVEYRLDTNGKHTIPVVEITKSGGVEYIRADIVHTKYKKIN